MLAKYGCGHTHWITKRVNKAETLSACAKDRCDGCWRRHWNSQHVSNLVREGYDLREAQLKVEYERGYLNHDHYRERLYRYGNRPRRRPDGHFDHLLAGTIRMLLKRGTEWWDKQAANIADIVLDALQIREVPLET